MEPNHCEDKEIEELVIQTMLIKQGIIENAATYITLGST